MNVLNVTDIMGVLNKLEAPKSNLGYKYIIEALLAVGEDETWIDKFTALYEFVGKKCNSTGSRVERAIRHEVELIFTNGNPSVINEVFGSYRKNNKLPNGEFLASLYYYLFYQKEGSTDDK